jgi:hypothetical protein
VEIDAPIPLLARLESIKDRYTVLARAFRDCHNALRDVKSALNTAFADTANANSIAVLRTAVERLDDVNEDVRVELEIRVADDERLAHGYATLLAIDSVSIADETAIEAFISGDDEGTKRALQTFSSKRADIEHDVAECKRALHRVLNPSLTPDDALDGSSEDMAARRSPSPIPGAARAWAGWATGGLIGSRPSSPAPPPSFGTVMTTPRGLRHATSLASLRRLSTSSTTAERPGLDPFVRLGLCMRVQMPSHVAMPNPETLPKAEVTSNVEGEKVPPRLPSVLGYASMFGGAQRPLGLPGVRTTASPAAFGRGVAVPRPQSSVGWVPPAKGAAAATGAITQGSNVDTTEGIESDIEWWDRMDNEQWGLDWIIHVLPPGAVPVFFSSDMWTMHIYFNDNFPYHCDYKRIGWNSRRSDSFSSWISSIGVIMNTTDRFAIRHNVQKPLSSVANKKSLDDENSSATISAEAWPALSKTCFPTGLPLLVSYICM